MHFYVDKDRAVLYLILSGYCNEACPPVSLSVSSILTISLLLEKGSKEIYVRMLAIQCDQNNSYKNYE